MKSKSLRKVLTTIVLLLNQFLMKTVQSNKVQVVKKFPVWNINQKLSSNSLKLRPCHMNLRYLGYILISLDLCIVSRLKNLTNIKIIE